MSDASKDLIENNNPQDDKENENELSYQKKIENIKSELNQEREKVSNYEKKIQYLLADFENLKKRSEIDVQNRVNSIADGIFLKFLAIYDDFIRAREVLSKIGTKTEGLDAILKNMNNFITEFGIRPIDCVGEIFDPKLHEAISIKQDPNLDDNTIVNEIRKGYILKDRIIRPSLVEISKKN